MVVRGLGVTSRTATGAPLHKTDGGLLQLRVLQLCRLLLILHLTAARVAELIMVLERLRQSAFSRVPSAYGEETRTSSGCPHEWVVPRVERAHNTTWYWGMQYPRATCCGVVTSISDGVVVGSKQSLLSCAHDSPV